jgi:hypothetical protein
VFCSNILGRTEAEVKVIEQQLGTIEATRKALSERVRFLPLCTGVAP